MHDVFKVLILRNFIFNSDLVVEYEPLEIQDYVTCEGCARERNRSLEFMVHNICFLWSNIHKKQMLCTRKIRIVKVLWRNHEVLRGIMVGGTRYKKLLSTLVRGS
jgi:hypothetical protein